jgi:type IV secretory pathway TrbF-like protein
MDPIVPDVPAALNGTLPEWPRMEAAYREIQARDSDIATQARLWHRIALAGLALIAGLTTLVVWQALAHHQVQTVVQVVQTDDAGRLIQMGMPSDVLAYTPAEGQWMDMLGSWVRAVRWRGKDPLLGKAQWGWAYRHTCGAARKLLQAIEEREKPFEPSKVLGTVELKSIVRAPAPDSYQVLWSENSVELASGMGKTQLWTGTFSVGRLRPATLTDAMDNRLGLCVSGFDLSQTP